MSFVAPFLIAPHESIGALWRRVRAATLGARSARQSDAPNKTARLTYMPRAVPGGNAKDRCHNRGLLDIFPFHWFLSAALSNCHAKHVTHPPILRSSSFSTKKNSFLSHSSALSVNQHFTTTTTTRTENPVSFSTGAPINYRRTLKLLSVPSVSVDGQFHFSRFVRFLTRSFLNCRVLISGRVKSAL